MNQLEQFVRYSKRMSMRLTTPPALHVAHVPEHPSRPRSDQALGQPATSTAGLDMVPLWLPRDVID